MDNNRRKDSDASFIGSTGSEWEKRHRAHNQPDYQRSESSMPYGPNFNTSYGAFYENSQDPEHFNAHQGSPDGKDYLRDSRENHPHRHDNFYAGRGPKNFKRSDERITDEICQMLTHHPEVDAEAIHVEVKAGEVTLTGTVPSRQMKHMAEDCADRCMGVKEVHNNIRVDKGPPDLSSERSTFLV